ncbi:MAG: hypothetical protein Q9181_004869 [Wetmoreana brouardii]
MTLRARDVVLAAVFAFIAWGFATHLLPLLRYLGYAFTAGLIVGPFALGAIGSLTVRKKQGATIPPAPLPRSVAFIEPKSWEAGTAYLSEKALYKREPLYPPSFVISESLDGLLDWLLRDLVSSWYNNITRNPSFVNSIDSAVRSALINIRDRIFAVDPVEVGVSRIVPIITRHLKDFYEAERVIRGKNLNRNVTESEELDIAIAAKYKDGKLHPAASLAYSDLKIVQQEYVRGIVVRLLPEVLPEDMVKSRAASVLIREIVSCSVIVPLLQLLSDPDTWNHLLEAYGRAMLNDRKSVRKIRAALDEYASPAPKSLRSQAFPRLSPHDDERKFERFVRAIRRCNNLSEARRFRSEVASQLKRESMLEGQDQTYLRRLETGRDLLDQKVGKLGAVGSSSTRRPQDDIRNGNSSGKIMNMSILQLLHDATGLSYFMEYMDRHRLMTLVQFWIVVDGFRNPLEDDNAAIDNFSGGRTQWTEADRMDITQIYESYLNKPELRVPAASIQAVQTFLKAGQDANMSQYLRARSAILKVQSAVLDEMQETHYPGFKRSDLYYKYLTFEEAAGKAKRPMARALKEPSIDSIPESPSKPAPPSRASSRLNAARADLRRNASSSNDLTKAAKAMENGFQPPSRRSLEVDTSGPLFDDDVDSDADAMMRSTHSIDNESIDGDLNEGHKEQMVEAMEVALNSIMTNDPKADSMRSSLFDDSDLLAASATKAPDSPRSSGELLRVESGFSDKERQRPSIASLGLVNTSSRIGVFTDNDLFGDDEKFSEDEHVSSEDQADQTPLDEEIHQAEPGDLGLAEAISALTADIERLVAQESVVDTLNRKAELTNNLAELRILGKSKSSLQREIRRKELQRQQYMVQESDNSLYGRASVNIKSIMVGREEDGQEFALYVIEVTRKASEQMSAASWAVARRYSEFHDLHQRLRRLYPAVRELDFPRRRLVMKLQQDFLHKRRISLENYLRGLLRLPAVCQSRDLRAFLSQSAIISKQDTGRDSERRDIISRIYNSVTDGMDEFLGNVPVLDQLSMAGQNLISAATNQFNAMPISTTSPTSNNINSDLAATIDPVHTAEARAELEAFSDVATTTDRDHELEPFIKPICDLFLETFNLDRGNNWLRGRAVVVVLHQLLGGTVERKVRDSVKALVAEDSVLKYINQLKESFWPNGGPMKREATVRTEAEKRATRREATVMLNMLVPDLAGGVVGRANAQAAARRIGAAVNNKRLLAHLVFLILDELVGVLFPPPRQR